MAFTGGIFIIVIIVIFFGNSKEMNKRIIGGSRYRVAWKRFVRITFDININNLFISFIGLYFFINTFKYI